MNPTTPRKVTNGDLSELYFPPKTSEPLSTFERQMWLSHVTIGDMSPLVTCLSIIGFVR